MKFLKVTLLILLLNACAKDKKVERLLRGEKWNITSYTITEVAGGNIVKETAGNDGGSFTFDKEGYATLDFNNSPLRTGKYDVSGSTNKKFDAIMGVEFSNDYIYYYINKDSRSKMRFRDASKYGAYYGDGIIINMVLEKE